MSDDSVEVQHRDLVLLEEDGPDFLDLITPLALRWRSLIIVTVLCGVLGIGLSFLIKPRFIATATFIPPQQQQSSASAALASLGALAGLGGAAQKSTADQFVALMQSVQVSNRLIDQFKLMDVYGAQYRFEAREKLAKTAQITVGKKDGLVSVAVEDVDPKRASAIANQYIEELRLMTSTLAVSEAQQRRLFFEKQLQETKAKLALAQTALQDSGFSQGALKAEPRAAAESYAKLKAELTSTEVMLQTRRESMADSSPELQALLARAQALREQLRTAEQTDSSPSGAGSDYVSKFREYKYQETLFELMSKQYELARVDEAREGALIQVVDTALVPEHKSSPKRGLMAIFAAIAGLAIYAIVIVVRDRMRVAMMDPAKSRRWVAFKSALRAS